MKDVTLKQRELARLQVLNDILGYQVPISQAAEVLGVTERHGRWHRRTVREGMRGKVPHKLRQTRKRPPEGVPLMARLAEMDAETRTYLKEGLAR